MTLYAIRVTKENYLGTRNKYDSLCRIGSIGSAHYSVTTSLAEAQAKMNGLAKAHPAFHYAIWELHPLGTAEDMKPHKDKAYGHKPGAGNRKPRVKKEKTNVSE